MRGSMLRMAKQPGLIKRTLQELQLETRRFVKGSYLHGEYDDLPILTVEDPSIKETIKVMCDSQTGGYSVANFDVVDERSTEASDQKSAPLIPKERPTIMEKGTRHISGTDNPLVYGLFHGSISTKLPKHRPEIQRSGYAGWRTLDRKMTLFGTKYIDIDEYKYLAFRVKSDGRKYFINIQTDTIFETDLHQHRLFTKRPGQWETVVVDPEEFVRTNYGWRMEHQQGIMLKKVKTIGMSVIDRVEGPFELAVEKIWATNTLPSDTATGPKMEGELEFV